MRADESAIIVGTNTAQKDNPSLTVREWSGTSPLRVVIDKELKLSLGLALFDQSVPTVVFTSKAVPGKQNLDYQRIIFDGSELDQILGNLHERGILSLIVEGGQMLLNSFITQNRWDEARVYNGNCNFYNGVRAPVINAVAVKTEALDDSWMFVYEYPQL